MKITPLILAAYLLLGSLFPRTDFSQLARLASMGQHYRLHLEEARQGGSEMSFGDFWIMHYFEPALHQGEHEQDHHNLPLQSIFSFVIHNFCQAIQRPVVRSQPFVYNRPAFENRLHLTGFPTPVFIPPSLP